MSTANNFVTSPTVTVVYCPIYYFIFNFVKIPFYSEVVYDSSQSLPFDILLTKVDVCCGVWGMYNFYKMQVSNLLISNKSLISIICYITLLFLPF